MSTDEANDERVVIGRIEALALQKDKPLATWMAETIRHDAPALVDTIAAELPRVSVHPQSVSTPNAASDLSLLKTIGEGGMGRVHLARQRSLERDVAVKSLKEGASHDLALALLREARITGALEHPGVVPIHALGVDANGQPLLVMKRVEGADFADLLADETHEIWRDRQGTKIDRLAAKLEIFLQVCRTLEFAHAKGVIHRDIKPANVMVGRYGEVYLLDWGIATKKNEASKELVGTLGFMPPEMFVGGVVDERTDVYLLGAMLHIMLTGTLRHEGDGVHAVARAALASLPVAYAPEIPPQLADICNRATSRAPADRPQSAAHLRDLVTDFLQHRAAVALSFAAQERLASFNALLANAKSESAPLDLASAYRLVTEARFGFTQCLRSHPTHEEATVGARASVAALVELELLQGHAESAEAWLHELDEKDPALEKRVTELREKNEAQTREAARLQALGRDVDPTIGLAALIAVVISSVLISVVMGGLVLTGAIDERSVWVSVSVVGCMMVLTGSLAFALRNSVFKYAFNRRIGAIFFLALSFWLVDRVVCGLTGTPVSGSFVTDLWILAAALGAGAIAMERRLAISALTFAVAAVGMRVRPDLMSLWFSTAMVIGMATFAGALLAQSRKSKEAAAKSNPSPKLEP